MGGGDGAAGPVARESPFTGRTAWVRNLETPLRSFLRTETGSAAVLLAAAVAALVWANLDSSSCVATPPFHTSTCPTIRVTEKTFPADGICHSERITAMSFALT